MRWSFDVRTCKEEEEERVRPPFATEYYTAELSYQGHYYHPSKVMVSVVGKDWYSIRREVESCRVRSRGRGSKEGLEGSRPISRRG
jgi:hypothetical protein